MADIAGAVGNPGAMLSNFSVALPRGTATIIGIAMLIVVVLGIVGFLFWKAKTYKHRAIILENRNGQLVEFRIAYRYKTIRLADCVKFWGSRKYVEKPSQDYIKRVNGRDVIYYHKGNDNYVYPVKLDEIDENTKTIKQRVAKSDADFWSTLRLRNEIDRWSKKTFLEQYGGIMMAVIFSMIFIIGNWIIWNGMKDAVAPLGETGNNIAESNRLLAGILNDTYHLNGSATGIKPATGGIISIPGVGGK